MLVYADASALVKLVRDEAESGALRSYLEGADLVSSAIVLAEVSRAVRRAATDDPRLPLELLLDRATAVLDAVARIPVDEPLLFSAGAIAEPGLRALDAIHVAAALSISPVDAFVSYDQRQSAAARLSGLRTVTPG
ncbi:MAG: type II toxin-antitoxin system VapC family toxin [Solirubrobacterales bacterium]|nr:type II toxin-antitoxin system VapC family toxin [Solirubrobacterales bacterium]